MFSFTTSHHCDAGLTLVTWRSEFSWQRVGASTPGLHISTLHKSYLSIWAAINSPQDINLFQLFTAWQNKHSQFCRGGYFESVASQTSGIFQIPPSPRGKPAWKDYDLWGCHFYFPARFKWCKDCCVYYGRPICVKMSTLFSEAGEKQTALKN